MSVDDASRGSRAELAEARDGHAGAVKHDGAQANTVEAEGQLVDLVEHGAADLNDGKASRVRARPRASCRWTVRDPAVLPRTGRQLRALVLRPLASVAAYTSGWQSQKRTTYAADLHVYSLEWTSSFMRFSVDSDGSRTDVFPPRCTPQLLELRMAESSGEAKVGLSGAAPPASACSRSAVSKQPRQSSYLSLPTAVDDDDAGDAEGSEGSVGSGHRRAGTRAGRRCQHAPCPSRSRDRLRARSRRSSHAGASRAPRTSNARSKTRRAERRKRAARPRPGCPRLQIAPVRDDDVIRGTTFDLEDITFALNSTSDTPIDFPSSTFNATTIKNSLIFGSRYLVLTVVDPLIDARLFDRKPPYSHIRGNQSVWFHYRLAAYSLSIPFFIKPSFALLVNCW
ncbi:hypothetical protein DFH11DRAFT_1725934 [Phellopilus nigrolimitatus]|nr:hypothetical protein DFH11DRAFT_1725934 [Phellopilus nigrolimitatus]